MHEFKIGERYACYLSGLNVIDRIFDAVRLGAELAERVRLVRCSLFTQPAVPGDPVGNALLSVEGIHRLGSEGSEWMLFGFFANDAAVRHPRTYNVSDFPQDPVLCGNRFHARCDVTPDGPARAGIIEILREPFFRGFPLSETLGFAQ